MDWMWRASTGECVGRCMGDVDGAQCGGHLQVIMWVDMDGVPCEGYLQVSV